MSSQEINARLRSRVTDPVSSAIGDLLLRVSYLVLDFEVTDFILDRPNLTGLSYLHLTFCDALLEFTWSSKRPLRPTNAYHIEVTQPISESSYETPSGAAEIVAIEASQAKLWAGAIGTRLQAAEVLGVCDSPQAIRLQFPSASVIVTIGNSHDAPLLGDGDEVLLLSEGQWTALPKFRSEEWTTMWSSAVQTEDILIDTGAA